MEGKFFEAATHHAGPKRALHPAAPLRSTHRWISICAVWYFRNISCVTPLAFMRLTAQRAVACTWRGNEARSTA